MRADRLVAILLMMQARGRVTASEVATELEVSVATARRDLEALGRAGIPVYPQPGRGGGWSLLGGARLDLTGLSSIEAQALLLPTRPNASDNPAVKSAQRKLIQALPATLRVHAAAAAEAVVVDPSGWGERQRLRASFVDTLQEAVIARRGVSIDYRNRDGEQAVRVVEPWGLADKDGIWYLIAGTSKGQRTFRIDRITDVDVTDRVFERPLDFDLSKEWASVVTETEQHRSLFSATLLIAERFLPVLQDHFGRHCEALAICDDGRVRVRVAAPMAISIAENLAGWGSMIEVLEPGSVRQELARIGAELTARYQNP